MSSLFDHPWFGALLGDAELERLWSAEAQLAHFIRFEAAFARGLGVCGVVDAELAERAARAIETAQIDQAALRAGAAQDGVPIPALVRILRAAAGDAAAAVHHGATSQDVMDTALAMTTDASWPIFDDRLERLRERIATLSAEFPDAEIMGRTRMQAALRIKAAHRLTIWAEQLSDAQIRFNEASDAMAHPQLGGAVGDSQALGEKHRAMHDHLGQALGLSGSTYMWSTLAWHANRMRIGVYGAGLSLITGALGKIGQDVALMAQQGVDEIKLAGGGGSSAMPHKSNPIEAELLVALARYNAAELGGLHQALIHEQERSGAAWTLEWLLLPGMARAAGAGLLLLERLLNKIERVGDE